MKSLMTLLFCAALLAFTIPASAILGMPETLEGTIESVSQDTIAIISQKGTTQQMVEIDVNLDTKFEDTLASLDNLQKGDKVRVKYKEEGNEKVAVTIAKIMDKDASAVPEASYQL